MSQRSSAPPPRIEPVLTRRLLRRAAVAAVGLGLMFLSGPLAATPVPAGIASGILLLAVGLVLVVLEGLREP